MNRNVSLNDSWRAFLDGRQQERPELSDPAEGLSVFGAYCRGWNDRYQTDLLFLNGLSEDVWATVKAKIKDLSDENERLWSQHWNDFNARQVVQKNSSALREQIRSLKADESDAPLFVRISAQRKELKRLQAEVLRLRGEIAEMKEAASDD